MTTIGRSSDGLDIGDIIFFLNEVIYYDSYTKAVKNLGDEHLAAGLIKYIPDGDDHDPGDEQELILEVIDNRGDDNVSLSKAYRNEKECALGLTKLELAAQQSGMYTDEYIQTEIERLRFEFEGIDQKVRSLRLPE